MVSCSVVGVHVNEIVAVRFSRYVDLASVDGVFFASTTAPYREKQSAATLFSDHPDIKIDGFDIPAPPRGPRRACCRC